MVAELSGSVETALVERLRGQVAAAADGGTVARLAAVGGSDRAELDSRVRTVERAGDDERARLVDLLSMALMTPFDREDLFRISRSLDDVLDNLRDFVREVGLFGVSDERFVTILDAVDDCLGELDGAVAAIRGDNADVVAHALRASKAGNRVRQRYQEALADLLSAEEVTPELLKHRELLRRLDVVGLRLNEAADALADGAVKRG